MSLSLCECVCDVCESLCACVSVCVCNSICKWRFDFMCCIYEKKYVYVNITYLVAQHSHYF